MALTTALINRQSIKLHNIRKHIPHWDNDVNVFVTYYVK